MKVDIRKRKKLISLTGAGLATLGSLAGYLSYQASFTPAEREMKRFPSSIPGAHSVDKYPVEDARYVLVHIKQRHKNPFQSVEEARSDQEVISCQRDIYKILDSREKSGDLAEIYLEGLALEYEKEKNTPPAQLESRVRALNNEQRDTFYNQMFISVGASQIFALEKRIQLRAAESVKLNRAGLQELGEARRKTEEAVKELDRELTEENLRVAEEAVSFSEKTLHKYDDPREDYAISSVVSRLGRDNFLAHLVYGGGHDFKDNVERWNNDRPNEKIALIVVTPEGFTK